METLLCQRPACSVQEKLADYLDRKCSQIDAIIARQQEVIEKLKAYKLSVITEAVTKGLNPDVPMKDSVRGVDWRNSAAMWDLRKAFSENNYCDPEEWPMVAVRDLEMKIHRGIKVLRCSASHIF